MAMNRSPGATPPMGWNSWNAYSCAVTEDDIRTAADTMVETGFREAGYEYLVVDDCWMAGETDSEGRLQADPVDFPSGIETLAEYVHDRGLKFGIYSSAGTHTCQGYPASLGRERLHAEQFADWGVDYLKYDNCGDHRGRDALDRYSTMGQALQSVDREIVYSICEWGENAPWRWGRNAGGQLWRVTDDIVAKWQAGPDEFGLGVLDIIDRMAELSIDPFHGPRGWNDPDMLQVGNGPDSGQSQHEPTTVERPLSAAETRTHFSFWCLFAAPLMIGTALTDLSETDRKILTNEHLIAINQDPLGLQGRPVRRDKTELWCKRLQNGVAVALLNRGNESAEIRTHVDEVDVQADAERYHVLDCWSGEEYETASELVDTVEPRDTALLRVTPKE